MSELHPATKREALLAELIGDVHGLLGRAEKLMQAAEKLDLSLTQNTTSLAIATREHRDGIDTTVATVKKEISQLFVQATGHAARAATIDHATVIEKGPSINNQHHDLVQLKRKARSKLLIAIIASGAVSAILTTFYHAY
jgi:hypothetical protein